MIQITDKKQCCGCHGCAQVCPKQCIEMAADAEGFFYPRVDENKCIHCGLCEKVCPILKAEPDPGVKQPDAFAAMSREEKIRMESSSGGVFSLLAEQIIAQGGMVFGAAWEEDFSAVRHISVKAAADLVKLRGSKYLQSTIGDSYAQAKLCLDRDEPVLFSGTPCQIEGLRRFLRKEYDKLLCVDLVCHGVPSSEVWKKYLSECEKKAGASVSNVSFRNKKYGWKESAVRIVFANDKEQTIPLSVEPYMNAFLRNACLRPSCHDCKFKKLNRVSDLTLADFWGIEEIFPDMDDDKGTSLLVVHTPKGMQMLENMGSDVVMRAVDVKTALHHNPSMLVSSPVHPNRQRFLDSLTTMEVSAAVKRWLKKKEDPKVVIVETLRKIGIWDLIRKILRKK